MAHDHACKCIGVLIRALTRPPATADPTAAKRHNLAVQQHNTAASSRPRAHRLHLIEVVCALLKTFERRSSSAHLVHHAAQAPHVGTERVPATISKGKTRSKTSRAARLAAHALGAHVEWRADAGEHSREYKHACIKTTIAYMHAPAVCLRLGRGEVAAEVEIAQLHLHSPRLLSQFHSGAALPPHLSLGGEHEEILRLDIAVHARASHVQTNVH
jgi:hypothetical protein